MAVESQFYSENLGFQDWSLHPFSAVDNLCFDSQQPLFHFHPSSQQNLARIDRKEGVSSFSSSVTLSSMVFARSLNSELELQKQEIDFILQIQNEKLRNALHEQRRQQLVALLGNLEIEASNLMKQKEEDLVQATGRATELQERLKKAEVEKEAWKRVASAKEAMVIGLHNRLEEVRSERRQFLAVSNTEAEDAESCCGPCDQERKLLRKEEEEVGKCASNILACKSCYNRNPCILFLPCKHLCSCKFCEAFLGYCPVCNSVKEASMEVLLV